MAGGRIADQVGRVLGGRYRLVAPIGTGGSAHVYVADDTTLRRRVAVKVLQPALALDQAFLKRFRAEAQAAAALNHPNVMRVFDWGEDPEGPFLVMEFLEGGSLRDILDAGHRLTVLVGLEAARALDYAHRRGLVHRDIKPANICFDDEGRSAIADFGLARALAEAAWTEPDGVLLGTARYAAPEAAQGRNVDGKADVYALGWVLLEAVTGNAPPVADTTVATLMARATQPIVAPFGVGALGPIIDAAGVVDPDDRPDAAALAVMLDAAARQLDSPARIPITPVLNLDARTPSAADPTEMGVTAAVPVYAPAQTAATPVVGRKSRRRIGWAVGSLALVAAIVMAALYVPILLKAKHDVPSLEGDTIEQAGIELAEFKFKLASEEAFSETVENGQIISQDPGPGESLREDSTVRVVVSKGPPPVPVPSLADLTEEAARSAIEGADLVVGGIERRFDEEIPEGVVIDWNPKSEAPKGSQIALAVSRGAEPRTISNWKGKTFEEAKTAFESVGLVAKRVDGFSDDVAVGQIVSTSPGAGQTAEKGSTVTVVVSVGAATVTVPNVNGQTVEQATATLRAQGLNVGGVFGPGGKNRKVFFTSPGAGAKVKRGTAVNLYVQ